MQSLKAFFLGFVDLIHAVREKNLRWQEAHQPQLTKLSQDKALADAALNAQLRLQSEQLMHSIELLKTRQSSELSLLKTRCRQDLVDYERYLAALDKLGEDVQASFPHLPKAIALTIHHHAKSLLDALWETTEKEEKLKLEREFVQFLMTAQQEAAWQRNKHDSTGYPNATLGLMAVETQHTLPH